MGRLVALLFAGLVTLVAAAGVYRWVDEQGNVHYGDHPPPQGAEPIVLPDTRPPSPATGASAAPSERQPQLPATSPYATLALVTPQDGGTVRSNEGRVRVQVAIEPALLEGHYLELSLDGRVVGGRQTGLLMELQELSRGPHELQIAVFDAEGAAQGRSAVVRFYLLRTTTGEREAAEQEYQSWLNELQRERDAAIEAENRAQRERQLREQQEQKARVEERRRSDFEPKAGDSPRYQGGEAGYPGVPATQPGQAEKYRQDRTDLEAPQRPLSTQRRQELKTYDPAELPKQDSGEPADYDPAKAPKSGPIAPHKGPDTNPAYAPKYAPPPATPAK